ncbi:MAG: MaoC family dehydratase N-terminal domain-containing protein [Erythrobacter sp.]|nr:MaoC family dehydratase N-terminal domain-containing protein [Erythrobacter sp.]
MSAFEAWIGRETRAKDTLDEGLARRWLATFDLPKPRNGEMPQGIHFTLCTPDAPTRKLGEDGHPARDDGTDSFFPPFPLPRRMWASSAIEFRAPLAIGTDISRTSRVASINEKDGASGKLAFVDVEHETRADGVTAIFETQTLVYREAAEGDVPLAPPEVGDDGFDHAAWDAHRVTQPDPRLLFRYSALTFNTHRIHYDTPYARATERYRGLVVHGPLTASLLLQFAAAEIGENRLSRLSFRGVSPAIADEALILAIRQADSGIELGAFAGDGRQVMKASAAI